MAQEVVATSQQPIPPTSSTEPAKSGNTPANSSTVEAVKLKKEIGIVDAVGIIVGVIVGAGIFVSPKGVLKYSETAGQAIVIWISSGVLSLIGALCYAELGTMISKSGGDYAYISKIFGPVPAFLYLWVGFFILVPTTNAVTALTFAQYILEPMWSGCRPPSGAVRLLAAVVTCALTAVNCYKVKWATRVQDIFTGTKVFALIIIIIAGCYWLGIGHTENFQRPFGSGNIQPGNVALAMYAGWFSYGGWNYLNFITEELKEPYKNLPKAICISLPLVTITYVFVNVAYLAVLTPSEILASNAVAVTLGEKLLGPMSWIMPFFVACSTFGALNGAILVSSRLFFVGARNGQLPKAISLINIHNLTPIPSLILLCLCTLAHMVTDDVYSLINYVSFAETFFTTMSVCGLLWLRYKKPDIHRPIKVFLILPIIFFCICIFLIALPCYASPWEVGITISFIMSGIPVYYIFIYWQNKPKWLIQSSEKFYIFCSKLFMCTQEDKSE